jgi:TolB-like protein/Tfp pilus assembly protein PilF
MGDGFLVEFPSVVNAVACAAAIQKTMVARNADLPEDRTIQLRIGVNLGDVIVEGGDVFGDGVNIATRLEAMAEPGGICVSAKVHQETKGKISAVFDDMGEKSFKNIAEPVRVFSLLPPSSDRLASRPVVPSNPSIAVLAFNNLSGDPEQEYFADGMVEEITTALSRVKWLFVIARNSSFAYKGRAVDVKRIGQELGVRYLLEGSVRKAGGQVRIAGQLIDTTTGAHLWADRFDGSLADVFDLQEQVTASVVSAIGPKLEQLETERSRRKPTESLDAYDYFLRGMAAYNEWSQQGNVEARAMFVRAIGLDPNFASAVAMAARCHVQHKAGGWSGDHLYQIDETVRLARKAVSLGGDDAFALCFAGFTLAWVGGEIEEGARLIEKALELNPNMAWAWMYSGWAKVWQGEPEVAIERIARATRLNPQDPLTISIGAANACAHFFAGKHEEAWFWAEKAVQQRPDYGFPLVIAAASAVFANKPDGAKRASEFVRQLMPDFRIADLSDLFPMRRPQDVAKFADGLRRAGLPD